ncbi:metal ABC transporter solute-binding protein, Zn/Mn family [Tomitella biformata]|uniref:metal ABC transporter solute-binding protein, Zn/Mn family n=1 Tax=Tomitella biformata TaxID=630403 RepID=UPI0004676098|nr:zinc ABC transporter substrate-binding protein [Tomitella biformata]
MSSWKTKRRKAIAVAIAAAAMLASAGCGANGAGGGGGGRVQVVATFSIVADIAAAVGGDAVDVHSIVPLGTDPHEYTPLPLDIAKATDADLVIWNGLNMEMGDGWFAALVDIAGKKVGSERVVEASAGVGPMYLTSADGAGTESDVNPHAFLDPTVGMVYTENIRDGLIAADPGRRAIYTANADAYLAQLAELDRRYTEELAQIPQARRLLVTSENAYQYMAARYGLDTGYIWAIDTDEQGSPAQINALIALVQDRQPPALFVESNVDRRPMQTISGETGTPIFGTLYSDELGKSGDGAGHYLGMLAHNITTIHAGLAGV